MENETFYYVYPIKFNHKIRYVIWYESEKDGLVLDSDKKLVTFENIKLAFNYNSSFEVTYDEEFTLTLNIDKIISWLNKPSRKRIKPKLFLNTWNFFADLSYSLGDKTFDNDRKKSNLIYDKLFWGNNLPSVTPEGKYYKPKWKKKEVKKIKKIFKVGVKLLEDSLN